MLPEMEFRWWALIVGNFVGALTYAVIIDWSNMRTAMGGLKAGATIGFLFSLGMAMNFYSMSNMYTGGISTVVIDVIIGTVYSAIGGAVIGWVMGRGKAAATA